MKPLHAAFLVLVLPLLPACRSDDGADGPRAPKVDVSGFRSLGPALAVAAQPSADEFAEAKAAGYRTVVNFRAPGEPGTLEGEQAIVEGLGMRYVAIPVRGHDVQASDADLLDPVLTDPSAGPVLLHCRSGTRGKAVWTVWLAKHGGMTPDQALAEGERAGLSGDAKAAVEKVVR